MTGFGVGVACCMLILLFVRDELSYDRFHANTDRIHRIQSDWGDFSLPATNPPTVKRLRLDYLEIRIGQLLSYSGLVRFNDKAFRETAIYIANSEVLDIFTFPLLRGDPAAALTQPFTAVVTEEMAVKYFGNEDPVGKTLIVDNQMEVEITGIARNLPSNAHFHFDFLVTGYGRCVIRLQQFTTLGQQFDLYVSPLTRRILP